jgi:transposase
MGLRIVATSTRVRLSVSPLAPAGDLPLPPIQELAMEEVDEQELHVERVAALDLGKAALEACVRVPHESKPGRRLQEVRGYATTTGALLALADWLHSWGVTRVVMESTSDYWKGVYWLLEAEGFECWLVNARDVKNVPGRPKTDKADAVWLAKVAERGMCRPSLVHPRPIRQLRDLTRYRRSLIHDRTREMQRVEKLLEDAQIKLSVVASDIFGASGRAMLEALIAGQRDPKVLAELARGRLRVKHAALVEALTGQFSDHHGFIARMLLDQIDALSGQIDQLTARIEQTITAIPAAQPPAPATGAGGNAAATTHAGIASAESVPGHPNSEGVDPEPGELLAAPLPVVDRVDEVAGIGHPAAQVIIAEVGWTWASSPPRRTWCRGPGCHPAPSSPPPGTAPAPPARAEPWSLWPVPSW